MIRRHARPGSPDSMKVTPSTVPGITLIGPDEAAFRPALAMAGSAVPLEQLTAALPFSVIVANQSERAVALFAIRFDMLDAKAKPCSVVHYADTLRNPEKAGLPPGAFRLVCAEASFTALALEGRAPAARTRLNLANLRKMLQTRASLDCAAFADGTFAGPDSLGAFDRLAAERQQEAEFIEAFMRVAGQPATALEHVMKVASEGDRIRKAQARRLLEAFASGGFDAMQLRALGHRTRIALQR